MMEEKSASRSCLIVSKTGDDSLSAMYFGISCAFVALRYLSKQASDEQKCIETRDKMLQGSAQLLGLLVWKVQKEAKSIEKPELLHKLEVAESEISELKHRRSEDAKANEKVASIYAAREQGWFAERRQLQLRIVGLLNDLRIIDTRKNDTISDLNRKLQDMEVAMKSKDGKLQEVEYLVKSKDKMLEEGEKKRKELEEKVKSIEVVLEELRESTNKEARDHSNELLKHKTAFIELVSNQRQLEAELGRSLRQVEAAKQELHFVYEEKEEAVSMVQRLSIEIEKMRVTSEQKDEILTAMVRKLRSDSVEKQMVLKKVKKRRKDEIETERRRRRTLSGFRSGRKTLRSMLSRQLSSRFDVFHDEKVVGDFNDNVYYDFDDEFQKEDEENCLHLEQNLSQEAEFNGTTRLNEWVHTEAEKYHNAVQQRHQLELDAFSEQMQVKDDKLEVYRWKLKSTETESKRLQSQIEGLNRDMSQLRHDNLKLESLLLDREVELKTLKDQIAFQLNSLSSHRTKLSSSFSKVKITKKRPTKKEQELKKKKNLVTEEETESTSKGTSSTVLSTTNTEEKEVIVESNPACIERTCSKNEVMDTMCSNKRDKSQWKVDLHALGVSYKIKRLSQQLLMLDRLTGKTESEIKANNDHANLKMKGFLVLLSLLKKQVSRYQSLQQKIDDLSQRMGDKDLHAKNGVSKSLRTKEEIKLLGHLLEETFQLQRYIVATGQKLMELQPKIANGFIGISEDLDVSAIFDMKRFSDTIQTLFRDIQRGLEVRISRIIGDLEGILAHDGIHSWKH